MQRKISTHPYTQSAIVGSLFQANVYYLDELCNVVETLETLSRPLMHVCN